MSGWGRGGPLKFQGGEWKKESQRLASLPKQGSKNCEHRDQINLVSSAGYLVFWMGGSHVGGGHTWRFDCMTVFYFSFST